MKTLQTLAFIVILITGLTVNGQVSVTATANAEIVPITAVNEIQQMSFGKFSPIGAGGNIIVTPQGTRMKYGSVLLTESIIRQGIFEVTGTRNNTLNVILPNSPVYLFHQNGVNYLYLDNWSVDMPDGGNTTIGKDFYVNIGSTIHVGTIDANPIGAYQGSYTVIFFYN